MYRRIIEFDGVLGWLLIDIAKKKFIFWGIGQVSTLFGISLVIATDKNISSFVSLPWIAFHSRFTVDIWLIWETYYYIVVNQYVL